jgi:hypothetical protein
MPTPNNKTTNNLPQMTGDIGYGLGFFCGCLVGAVGTYLAFTPEGKQLKQKIIKEFRANQQQLTLESLLPEKSTKTESVTLKSLHQFIRYVKTKLTIGDTTKPTKTTAHSSIKAKKKTYFKQK